MADLLNKKILILGGVAKMLDAVSTAKSMGLKVYVTDYLEDSPCKKVADKSFMVSATDVDAVVDLIKTEKIDGVITGFVDSLLPYYTEICRKAGLPCYCDAGALDVLLNKKKIKEACIEHGILAPHMYSQAEIDEGKVVFPVIVKPVDGSGSRGCSVCDNEMQLGNAIKYALSFSKVGDFIVEEYIVGDTLGMQFFIQNGELTTMFLSDIKTIQCYEDKPKACVCQLQPSLYTDKFLSEIYPKYCKLFKDIGVVNGPIQIDSYIKDGEIYWGDIGYRLCGDVAHYLVNEAFGVDFFKLLINIALTGNPADYAISAKCDPHLFGKCAVQIEFIIRPGKVCTIIGGGEKTKSIPGVFYSELYIDEGFELKEDDRGKLVQVVGRTHLFADSPEQLKEALKAAFDSVDFLDSEGNSLKLKSEIYWECVNLFQNKNSVGG